MSWAEIKKAVNSRMADMPLDDMFGLEYVKTQAHSKTSQGTISVGNMTGLALVTTTTGGSYHGWFQIQDSGYTSDTYTINSNSTFALVPLSKGHYTSFTGTYFFVMIFAWGGGIS